MSPQPMQIQLSPQELDIYKQTDQYSKGYLAGVQNTLEQMKRMKIQEILDARERLTPTPAAATSTPSISNGSAEQPETGV